MPNRYSQYSLPNIQMNWVTPEIVQFTPQLADANLLAQSFARNEERQRVATAQKSAMDKTFNELRAQLHEDKDTMSWFDNFRQKYTSEVNDYVNLGDYSQVITAATEAADEAAGNAKLQGLIKRTAEYNDRINREQQRVGHGVNQDDFNYWKDMYKFKTTDVYDGNGNIVSVDLQEAPILYDSINMANITAFTKSLVTPKKGSTQVEKNRNYRNDTGSIQTFSDGQSVTPYYAESNTDGTYAEQWEKLTEEYIQNNIDKWIFANGSTDNYNSVIQAYNVAKWDYNRLEEEINKLKTLEQTEDVRQQIADKEYQLSEKAKILKRNGSPVANFKDYFSNLVIDNAYKNGMLYDYKFTSRKDSKAYQIGEPSTNNRGKRGPGNGDNTSSNPTYTEQAAPTVDQTDDDIKQYKDNVESGKKRANKLFKKQGQ